MIIDVIHDFTLFSESVNAKTFMNMMMMMMMTIIIIIIIMKYEA
jgi:hypothetical protein